MAFIAGYKRQKELGARREGEEKEKRKRRGAFPSRRKSRAQDAQKYQQKTYKKPKTNKKCTKREQKEVTDKKMTIKMEE